MNLYRVCLLIMLALTAVCCDSEIISYQSTRDTICTVKKHNHKRIALTSNVGLKVKILKLLPNGAAI